MAITKSTMLVSIIVYPEGDTPMLDCLVTDIWDDPEDAELPITKSRNIVMGKAVPEVDGIERSPTEQLPPLAKKIADFLWGYD